MKKYLSSLVLVALALVSCEKSDNSSDIPLQLVYEKTIVSFSFNLSDDYLQFYDIRIEGKYFDGKDINLEVTGNGTFTMETLKKTDETTVRVTATPKKTLPEIDTERKYTFANGVSGIIRAKVKDKDKDANMSLKSFDFSPYTSMDLPGKKLSEQTEAVLERKAIDSTIRFTVYENGNSVSVNASTVKDE